MEHDIDKLLRNYLSDTRSTADMNESIYYEFFPYEPRVIELVIDNLRDYIKQIEISKNRIEII